MFIAGPCHPSQPLMVFQALLWLHQSNISADKSPSVTAKSLTSVLIQNPPQATNEASGAFLFTRTQRTETRTAEARPVGIRSPNIFHQWAHDKLEVSPCSRSPQVYQRLYQYGCHQRQTSSLSRTWWQKHCLRTKIKQTLIRWNMHEMPF